MNITTRKYRRGDMPMITDVFNYYIENSFASFNEEKVDDHFLDIFFKENPLPKYVVKNENKIIGFGLLRKFHRAPAFDRTAELTYFILPEFAGKGIGSQLLNLLINDAKANKIKYSVSCKLPYCFDLFFYLLQTCQVFET